MLLTAKWQRFTATTEAKVSQVASQAASRAVKVRDSPVQDSMVQYGPYYAD